jgi:hypothetical protein
VQILDPDLFNFYMQVEMFVSVWTTHGKSVTEELKQRSLTPMQVIMDNGSKDLCQDLKEQNYKTCEG